MQNQGAKTRKPHASAVNQVSFPPPYSEDDAKKCMESVEASQQPHKELTSEIRDGFGDCLSIPVLYLEALQGIESTYGYPQIILRTYI
jgi:hypothetical protein